MIAPGPTGASRQTGHTAPPKTRRRSIKCRETEDLREEIRWLREEIRWLREIVELQGEAISPLLDIIKDHRAKDERRRGSQ